MSKLSDYYPICDALAALFHPHVEAVIHNLSTGTIAHIANPYSGRSVGDPSYLDKDEPLGDLSEADVIGPYRKATELGGTIRSISTVLRDNQGQPFGMLCINHDLSAFEALSQTLGTLLGGTAMSEMPKPLFVHDWRERMNLIVGDYLKDRSLSLKAAKREDIIAMVGLIEQDGLFQARGAADYGAKTLGISRATLYNYRRAALGDAA